MLPTNQRQEALSRAYVRAIAAQAGVICGELGQDYGIDMYLRTVPVMGQRYIDMGDQLDLQLKSSTRPRVSETEVVHDLEVRAYDVLRATTLGCPRLLVLLVLPEDESQWLSQSVEELILRRCAFWMSLRGAPATPNQATIRISIPGTNLFSVDAVRRLMQQLSEGGRP
ncbi:MAG TPA: DUF4365 domain-containing protein [Gemmataceae bacterium]|nr:DUF4365 domain-containing protein [Gemmataceae bacterium]